MPTLHARVAAFASALFCAFAALAVPASAERHRVNKQFFGTVGQRVLQADWAGGISQPSLDAMRRSGMGIVRKGADWQAAEPDPPVAGVHSYRWDTFDGYATQMALRGIRWRPVLAYSTSWAGVAGQSSQPRDVGSYAAYARAFAARYGRGGTFWSTHPSVPYLPVTRYEIWNEPNLHTRWRQHETAPEEYLRLYLHARHAIRLEDDRALVMTGGLGQKGDYLGFVRDMLAENRWAVRHIDAVALHPYARTVEGVMSHVRSLRSVLRQLGAGGVPIAITEVGWSYPAGISEYGRMRRLQSLVRETTRSDCGLLELQVHTWITAEQDPADREHWYGIANADGTLKPSAQGYTRAARRAANRGFWGKPRFPCTPNGT